jgi:hypothetical protein
MGKPPKLFILGLSLALMFLPLSAQTAAHAPAASTALTPTGQAPAEMTKKITELVHAEKYADAQQLTAGLLIAYPNDQRLIKAKAVIEKMLSTSGQAGVTPSNDLNNQSAQPLASADAAPLTGMDKVQYSSLIELARQAQQGTDLNQQKAALKRFMDGSGGFLEKHPKQMLLWQLRAASAISLNDPMAGYEAGQKLIASGAADSNDANLQRLLGQLNNKGWLDKEQATQQAAEAKRYDWLLGTWASSVLNDKQTYDQGKIVFSRSASGDIESYGFLNPGEYGEVFRGKVLELEQISWEIYLFPTIAGIQHYPSGWQPVISCQITNQAKRIEFAVPSQWGTPGDSNNSSIAKPNIYTLTRLSDSQSH